VSNPSSNDPIVVIRDLYKEFHRDEITIPVLMGINVDLRAGEYMALMGPSGSGKTTLLNMIAGLDRPTSGTIRVLGQDLGNTSESALARWRSQHIGFIFQLYNLIPVLTAFENVELPLTLTKLSKRERREHVEAALEVVALSDRGDHYPRQLSGGQEQRVAIARAIATDPDLLVADEPTGDLDATSAAEILDLMQRLNEEFGKTIVMVTHDPHAAARAGRLLHLEKGVLVDGEPAAPKRKEAVR
jgi:putative ABC transport system ATP-binding protein